MYVSIFVQEFQCGELNIIIINSCHLPTLFKLNDKLPLTSKNKNIQTKYCTIRVGHKE